MLKSYLSNRQQYTSVNGLTSGISEVTHGVPQGSSLGPLLFLVMINDFPNCTEFFKFVLFADDSNLSCVVPRDFPDNRDLFIRNVNLNLSKVSKWLDANSISLNLEKTVYMIFNYRRNLSLGSDCLGSDLETSQ